MPPSATFIDFWGRFFPKSFSLHNYVDFCWLAIQIEQKRRNCEITEFYRNSRTFKLFPNSKIFIIFIHFYLRSWKIIWESKGWEKTFLIIILTQTFSNKNLNLKFQNGKERGISDEFFQNLQPRPGTEKGWTFRCVSEKSFSPEDNFSQLFHSPSSFSSCVDKLKISSSWHWWRHQKQKHIQHIEIPGVISKANSIHHQGLNFIPMLLDPMLHAFRFNLLHLLLLIFPTILFPISFPPFFVAAASHFDEYLLLKFNHLLPPRREHLQASWERKREHSKWEEKKMSNQLLEHNFSIYWSSST